MSEKIPQGKLKVIDISDIKWDMRYREDLGDLEGLSESIKEKGILQPITVSTDLTLLAGQRRITAAKMAGLTKIPALIREVTGEIDAREVELFENIHRKSFSWDEEVRLIRDIDTLYKEKNIEWSGRKTAALLDKGVATVSRAIQLANAMDAVPEISQAKTADDGLKLLKKMEEHAIVAELRERQKEPEYNIDEGIKLTLKKADANYRIGDTFKGLAELRSGGMIQVIECDPPYGIDLTKVKASKDSIDSNVHTYNEIEKGEYPKFLQQLAKELYRVANSNCWLIFWYGPTWHQLTLDSLRGAGWEVDEIPCIWAKQQGQTLQPERYFARGYEPFFLARKGNPIMYNRGRLNVFNFPGVPGQLKYHPTERPVALIEAILEAITGPNEVCLIPFLGSGATLRAVYNLGMLGMGWDINGEYKDKFMLAVEKDCHKMLEDSTEGDDLDVEDTIESLT